MFNRLKKRIQGFTLVELMIVVAIIGILAAIAIPAFLRYIKASKTAESEQVMKKMAEGSKAYFASEQRYTPTGDGDQPWHAGNATPGQPDSYGMPVEWDNYVFPGGVDFNFCSVIVSDGTAPCAIGDLPTGGAKKNPPQQTNPGVNAALNKWRVGFEDAAYFGYTYTSLGGTGESAAASIIAQANFKENSATAHTTTQTVSVDDSSQEVQISPAYTQNEFE